MEYTDEQKKADGLVHRLASDIRNSRVLFDKTGKEPRDITEDDLTFARKIAAGMKVRPDAYLARKPENIVKLESEGEVRKQANIKIKPSLKEKVDIYCIKERMTIEDFFEKLLESFFSGQGEIVNE